MHIGKPIYLPVLAGKEPFVFASVISHLVARSLQHRSGRWSNVQFLPSLEELEQREVPAIVPPLAGDNLIYNPWFRDLSPGGNPTKAGLYGWTDVGDGLTDTKDWTTSQKYTNNQPSPDNVVPTAAKYSLIEPYDPTGWAEPDDYEMLYQVVAAEPGATQLKLQFYWIMHDLDLFEVKVYGSNSANGGWTELWTPHQASGDFWYVPPGTNEVWWAQTPEYQLQLSQGYSYYKLQFNAVENTPIQNNAGVKFTGIYFTAVGGSAGNQQPQAVDDSYVVTPGATLTVSGPGLLANDTDLDGPNPLTVGNVSAPVNGGTLTWNADGSFSYTPYAGFTGDSFSYQAYDGTNWSGPATVSLTPATSNLLSNAGFEEGLAPWAGAGSVVETPTHSGTAALRIQGAASDQSVSQTVKGITAGTSYTGSVWINTSQLTSGQVKFQLAWKNASGRIISRIRVTLPAGSSWQQLSLQATAPAGAVAVEFKLLTVKNSAGLAYFDDAIFNVT